MKTQLRFILATLALVALSTLNPQLSSFAQGTAFTYQGRLNDGANPANGIYDLRFTLYDAPSGGNVAGGPLTNATTSVNNGLFTVALDFGAGMFTGPARWLDIGVRTNGGGAFTPLLPLQPLTPAPYAITASNLSGTLPATQLTGTVPDAQLSGNVSLFGSAIDSLEIADGTIVNADVSPSAAIADTKLATISTAGKVANSALSSSVSLLGQSIESGEIIDGTITTNDFNASLLNGTFWKLGGNTGANPTNGNFIGTTDNQSLEFKVNNQRGLRLEYATNFSSTSVNVIGGYISNVVGGGLVGATIAGGGTTSEANSVQGNFGTVGGGSSNTVSTFAAYATVGGGHRNTASSLYTTVSGGQDNAVRSPHSTVGGGRGNTASDAAATVGGGELNTAGGAAATVSGGSGNIAEGHYATIPGGQGNSAENFYSFAAGRQAKALHQGAFVWADSTGTDFASTTNDQFLIRAAGGVAIGTNDPAGAALRVAGSIKADSFLGMGTTLMLGTTDNQPLEFKVNNQRGLRLEYVGSGPKETVNLIGGFSGNFVSNGVLGATIGGGGVALADAINSVLADFGTVSGGLKNTVSRDMATVGGGRDNTASGPAATVGGGQGNTASGLDATIGGGVNNRASGSGTTVGGGVGNHATGVVATVPGGEDNVATNYAFAAGRRAQANHDGAFVWADSTEADFASTGNNQFLIRASGGVGIGTAAPDKPLSIQGTGGNGEWLSLKNTSGATKWHLNNRSGGLNFAETGVADNRLFLAAGGNVGIGKSPSSRLHIKQSVDGSATFDSTGGIRLERADTTAYWQIENWDDNDLAFRHSSGAAYFFIRDTDGTQAIASDRNLKKDIEPLSPMLDRVLALRPVSFRYKPVAETEPPTLGFVAQDVEKVLPELVEQKGEHKMLTIGGLIPVSIAAIQELNGKVDSETANLRAALKEKETEITELKQRLERIEQLLAEKLNGGAL